MASTGDFGGFGFRAELWLEGGDRGLPAGRVKVPTGCGNILRNESGMSSGSEGDNPEQKSFHREATSEGILPLFFVPGNADKYHMICETEDPEHVLRRKKQLTGIKRALTTGMIALSLSAAALAQPRGRGGPRLSFAVTTSAWPDGGEVPMKFSMRGENKSPEWEFHWTQGTTSVAAPDAVKSYVATLRDMENATNRGPADTLHWAAFNIPGTAKGLPEGLGGGDLPDGTRNGPGFSSGRGQTPSYVGPGAGPGPIHHYAYEFFALDTTLDLPAKASRDEVMKAMEGHVIGKATYFGRFHAAQ